MKYALPLLLATLSPLALISAPALAATTATPAEQLKKLFADSDEAALQRNPIQATFRGDLRYADRLGDYVSDDYYQAERKASEADLSGLKAIKRAALGPTDRIAYDVFEWQTKLNLKGYAPDILALTAVRPIDHFSGFQTFYPDFASGQGAAPFKTVVDYDNNLKRHAEYVILIDRAIGQFRKGMASGVVQPKLVVNNVIDQLNTQIAQGVEGSPLFGPVKEIGRASCRERVLMPV